MHYLPFGARLNKGILMVTQLIQGFSYKRKERETGLELSGSFRNPVNERKKRTTSYAVYRLSTDFHFIIHILYNH